jgi:hypothetical protein
VRRKTEVAIAAIGAESFKQSIKDFSKQRNKDFFYSNVLQVRETPVFVVSAGSLLLRMEIWMI